MATVVWRNIALIPEEMTEVGPYGEPGWPQQSRVRETNSIFVYMRRGAVIEVHPATGVHLTESYLEVLDDELVVAAYPRERVVMASHHPVSPIPFC